VTPHPRSPLLDAALARVGTGSAFTRHIQGGTVKITHPAKGYTGHIRVGGRRIDFLDGEAEATNLSTADRNALSDAGYTVTSGRAAAADKDDDGK
jgi:uridine phosphorylase